MPGKVKPIPEGYEGATPYLSAQGAAAALDFYKEAFGARELMRMADGNGKIGHSEFSIGGARIMLADEFPEMGVVSPKTLGGSPVTIFLYVEDVDSFVDRAVAAGARITRPIEDKFYGDRGGKIEDPFGHHWYIATHTEDVSEEEMKRRAEAMKPATKK